MGRSRAATQASTDDTGQGRSKRKRTAQNVEHIENVPTVPGITDGKKALYHCNYCNKDISGKIRIKCVLCSDFDLCVECFSVGAEVHPHKNNHPYRVMDNLAFPLICPDWNADEEMLLLEGIEMYGLGNWNEVAEHVGTKSKAQCVDHYNMIYMNSPCFPLPDMSHVMGKNREELVAMAKEQSETMKGTNISGDAKAEEQFPPSAKIKVEDQRKEGPVGRSSSNISAELGAVGGSNSGKIAAGGVKRASSKIQGNDGLDTVKIEEFHADRSIGEKKPRTAGEEGGVSLKELSGYNSKRQEFDVEYDNDAEQLLADLEFKETDTDAERELKLRILRIYSKRLDERKRRKDFILERNLLYPDPFEKQLTQEEKELCHRYRVFMRFHSKEEHDELLRSIVEEHRILRRIQDLQEARAAGCRTSSEADRFIEQKMKREMEENSRRAKESSSLGGASGKYLQRMSHQKGDQDSTTSPSMSDPDAKDSSSITTKGPSGSDLSDSWDVTGFLGADMLSEAEKQLCGEIRILPTHYLNMLQTMSLGILNGNVTKKSDAHGLFNVDPGKVDKVYDMLIRKGIAQT